MAQEDGEQRQKEIIELVMDGLLHDGHMFCFDVTFEFDQKKFRLILTEETAKENTQLLQNN